MFNSVNNFLCYFLMQNQVANLEAVPTTIEGFNATSNEKIAEVEHVFNDTNEMSFDYEKIDMPVKGDGGGSIFTDDLSPNTMKELEIVMEKFDNRSDGAKVADGALLGEQKKKSGGDVEEATPVKQVVEEFQKNDAGEVANDVVENVATARSTFNKVANEVGSAVADLAGEVSSIDVENVENVILEVAREVSNNANCNETMDDFATIFQKRSHDEMKDAGVVIFSYFYFDIFKLYIFLISYGLNFFILLMI